MINTLGNKDKENCISKFYLYSIFNSKQYQVKKRKNN